MGLPDSGMKFHAENVPPMPTVTGRVRCAGPIMAEDFQFLKSAATIAPKLTIPAPAMLHLRGGRSAISREHYPDLAVFWADVAAAYRAAIAHIAAAGCTYLQLDDVSCPPLRSRRGTACARVAKTAALPPYAAAINQALTAGPRHDGAMHTCRAISEHVARVGRLEDPVVESMF